MDAQTAGRGMTELLGLAAEGAVFYTEAADHCNCPVGSYTHGVTLPPERAKELEDVVGTMVGLQYIRVEEVAALPRRAEPFRVAVYAPPRRPTWCWSAAARGRSCWWPRPRAGPGSRATAPRSAAPPAL